MKTKLLIFLSIIFISNSLLSQQCSFTLAPVPGHIKITTNQNISASATVYWICSGLTVNVSASPGAVFMLESNVTLNITGSSGDAVNAKSGCIINNSSSADITVTSNTSNVTRNNTGSGSITSLFCASVVFDYSLLGVGGGPCAGVNGIEEYSISSLHMYPNPVSQGADIIINETTNKISSVKMIDLTGKIIYLSNDNKNRIPTGEIKPGFYLLEMNIDNTKRMSRILIE